MQVEKKTTKNEIFGVNQQLVLKKKDGSSVQATACNLFACALSGGIHLAFFLKGWKIADAVYLPKALILDAKTIIRFGSETEEMSKLVKSRYQKMSLSPIDKITKGR